jgi:hypothetical protein
MRWVDAIACSHLSLALHIEPNILQRIRAVHPDPGVACVGPVVLGFYPGGTRGVFEGHGEGLPDSITDRCGAYLARPARGRTKASQGIKEDVEGKGTKLKGVNQVDIQTAVQDR